MKDKSDKLMEKLAQRKKFFRIEDGIIKDKGGKSICSYIDLATRYSTSQASSTGYARHS